MTFTLERKIKIAHKLQQRKRRHHLMGRLCLNYHKETSRKSWCYPKSYSTHFNDL